jgi:hypothetical protein
MLKEAGHRLPGHLTRYVRGFIESGEVALEEVEPPWPGAQPMFRPLRKRHVADFAELAECDLGEAIAIEYALQDAWPGGVRASELGQALCRAGVRSSQPLAQILRRLVTEGAPLEELGVDRGQPCFVYTGYL